MSLPSDNSPNEVLINNDSRPKLGLAGLVGIAVISVDSIRNLPINAQYGLPVLTFYIIAGLTFFWPLLSATREFAGKYPITGGSYLWVQSAFGLEAGFLSIWLQWVYNMIWYPTIFTFTSSTLASLVNPNWENAKLFILLSSLIFFWIITAISARGIEATSWFSMFSSIIGTLLPMAIIIILAVSWLSTRHESATPISFSALFPTQSTWGNLGYYANILFSLFGIEVVAMHAKEVRNPKETYSKALTIAGFIIIISLTLASISLCVVVSPKQLSLQTGLMDAFSAFFNSYSMPWATYCIGVAIIFGSLGVASSWIIGLARGIQVACSDAGFPAFLQRKNKHQMPYMILLIQGGLYSLLVMSYLIFPNISNSYWLLSTMTSQFSLVYYLLLFMSVMKLRKDEGRLYWKTALGPCCAILSSLTGIVVGYLPPSSIANGDYWKFELLLIGGEVAFLLPMLFIWRRRRGLKSDKASINVYEE